MNKKGNIIKELKTFLMRHKPLWLIPLLIIFIVLALMIAFGSGAELETQIEIAKRRRFDKKLNFDKTDNLLLEVMKMLNKIIFTLRSQN